MFIVEHYLCVWLLRMFSMLPNQCVQINKFKCKPIFGHVEQCNHSVLFMCSKIEVISRTVHTNSMVVTWLDGSKICHPIFNPSTVTVPDKWLVVYRNQCQCSHRWYSDGWNHRPYPLFWVFSNQICIMLLTRKCENDTKNFAT